MPNGTNVRPQKWNNVIDLYDDGEYSAIWGNYDGSQSRVLGVRYNGGTKLGYPNMAGNPVWYIEPKFLRKTILLSLLEKVISSNLANRNEYINNLIIAIQEENI